MSVVLVLVVHSFMSCPRLKTRALANNMARLVRAFVHPLRANWMTMDREMLMAMLL